MSTPHHAQLGLLGAAGLLVAALGLWSAPADAGAPTAGTPGTPAPTETGTDDFDPLDNAACEGCHADVAREWAGSLHRRSYTNTAFQASHAREPMPFCQGCHAPRAEQFPAEPAAADLGIDCVTCHVKEGELVAGPGPAPKASAPHPITRQASLGAPDDCGGCHQFEFPRQSGRRPGALMQRTVDEHAASDFAGMDCADCHMQAVRAPERPRGRHHGFDVSRNEAFMRASLEATAERSGTDRVTLQLAPREVGHFMPTGDLFRRLALRVWAEDARGRELGAELRYLARHFPDHTGGRFFPDEPDDRLRGPTSFEFTVPGATRAHTLRWSVTYERVGERDPAHPERSEVVGAIELASGILPAPGRDRP